MQIELMKELISFYEEKDDCALCLSSYFSRCNSMLEPINFYYPSKIIAHCGEESNLLVGSDGGEGDYLNLTKR